MPQSMAQEQSGGVRRRNLESPMKESQARTKVVLRHLPPSMPQSVLLEYIDSKFAGCYTWFSFRPGKASVKKQILSRAYINFKKPEDVYDFCEDFDGHVFVNEKGTQYKVTVEYAPYQRTPKPRSKKDIREGTITKDPDYLEFVEMLGKPLEYLPSAEVQLERREAEKAAALGAGGGKETVVVTPLMEFVRQRRAAKAAPQRSLSSKLASRAGGVTVATSNLASHKRGLGTSRSGPMMDFKEVQARDHTGGQRREEQQQRKEREVVIERRKKEVTEAKEKKFVREPVSTAISAVKGNAAKVHLETSVQNMPGAVSSKDSLEMLTDGELKANEVLVVDVEPLSSPLSVPAKSAVEGMLGDVAKDLNKRELGKRKQLMVTKEKEVGPTSPRQLAVAYNQRHRPPVSPRVTSPSTLPQLATSGEGSIVAVLAKPNQRRDLPGRNSSRGALSPRDQQSPSHQHTSSHAALLLDSQSRQSSPHSDRGGKRPPRPQNVRLAGKEQVPSLASPIESEVGTPLVTEEKFSNTSASEAFSATERQDSRRVRNKDRPDRPVWTPRRRSDTVQNPDASPSVPSAGSTSENPLSDVPDSVELTSKPEKTERGFQRIVGNREVHHGTGQQPEGGRSLSGSGSLSAYNSVSGKGRYAESGGTRSRHGARSVPGNAVSNQEHAVTNHAEQRSDRPLSGTNVDAKAPQLSLYPRENGESHVSSVADKEKRKQDSTPQWNELTGGSHRSGERRRERSAQQHGSRDSDGSAAAAELSKSVKRGGSLALGSYEKQVWVAVQKSGTGT